VLATAVQIDANKARQIRKPNLQMIPKMQYSPAATSAKTVCDHEEYIVLSNPTLMRLPAQQQRRHTFLLVGKFGER
jgi:hypothetical protein